jgi:hypothetical protein
MFWETTTSRLTYLERNDGGDQWYFKFGEDTAQLLRIDPREPNSGGQILPPRSPRPRSVPHPGARRHAVPGERHDRLDELFAAVH